MYSSYAMTERTHQVLRVEACWHSAYMIMQHFNLFKYTWVQMLLVNVPLKTFLLSAWEDRHTLTQYSLIFSDTHFGPQLSFSPFSHHIVP